MTSPATTVNSNTQTVTIAAPPYKVFEFVADGANLPRWAIGFAASVHPADSSGGWVVTTGHGDDVPVKIRSDRDAGTVDFHMTPAPEASTCAYSRVVPNGTGADYLFTQLQPPGMTDQVFDALVDAVRHELTTLKALLEVACPN
jgi:hypothetical protein